MWRPHRSPLPATVLASQRKNGQIPHSFEIPAFPRSRNSAAAPIHLQKSSHPREISLRHGCSLKQIRFCFSLSPTKRAFYSPRRPSPRAPSQATADSGTQTSSNPKTRSPSHLSKPPQNPYAHTPETSDWNPQYEHAQASLPYSGCCAKT